MPTMKLKLDGEIEARELDDGKFLIVYRMKAVGHDGRTHNSAIKGIGANRGAALEALKNDAQLNGVSFSRVIAHAIEKQIIEEREITEQLRKQTKLDQILHGNSVGPTKEMNRVESDLTQLPPQPSGEDDPVEFPTLLDESSLAKMRKPKIQELAQARGIDPDQTKQSLIDAIMDSQNAEGDAF